MPNQANLFVTEVAGNLEAEKQTREIARRVLTTEAEALMAMANDLPTDFELAVNLILSSRGRVITSGMGKSGHIARKIAATLASTGTPSFFVHPAEASHGDLGMVTEEDVCLLISNSGETSELGDITAHCVRFGIPIIGISKNNESSLMMAATCELTLPAMPEACSIGMAPTTSTTLTLGLGDALAVALMERRKFDLEHFRTYHPGGKLGARLATVDQLMHSVNGLPLVDVTAMMSDAVLEMTARGFGFAGVVDDSGRLIGVISDGDLRRNLSGLLERNAFEVASKNPVTISSGTLAAKALATLNEHSINVAFVVDDRMFPLGIVHVHDCLRAGVS
ncbi:KpsF/GutQ family sugar-phosphate isomerase [Sphingobium yanoikuyae]|jgi:arabinose-5-phosphate isomerase|uniref:KpsF/GutQ family sugar-phosphate isomerase n=1 Tax=Sphingobium yanoikuyae TaxID=13690 RepID=A0A0J9CU95_SPHYA|nr:KpsF/GutQ family sugar-phosphate isomerase [Sphingobium yanoikuyae]ATP17610.1 KpsF/GutQ family sugar-phosphate isomerase [Sphingobium yanoikuyae]KMW28708.1 D-arabinose 5-phosphate [Sphingobium yanoikuyae]